MEIIRTFLRLLKRTRVPIRLLHFYGCYLVFKGTEKGVNIAEDIETTRFQDSVYLLKNASQIRDPDKEAIGRAY